MATLEVSEIENEFAQLSTEAQLSLLERLVHRTRVAVTGQHDTWEAGLSAMAADPEMQRELSRINAEFHANASFASSSVHLIPTDSSVRQPAKSQA